MAVVSPARAARTALAHAYAAGWARRWPRGRSGGGPRRGRCLAGQPLRVPRRCGRLAAESTAGTPVGRCEAAAETNQARISGTTARRLGTIVSRDDGRTRAGLGTGVSPLCVPTVALAGLELSASVRKGTRAVSGRTPLTAGSKPPPATALPDSDSRATARRRPSSPRAVDVAAIGICVTAPRRTHCPGHCAPMV